jgi:hypothetical protein
MRPHLRWKICSHLHSSVKLESWIQLLKFNIYGCIILECGYQTIHIGWYNYRALYQTVNRLESTARRVKRFVSGHDLLNIVPKIWDSSCRLFESMSSRLHIFHRSLRCWSYNNHAILSFHFYLMSVGSGPKLTGYTLKPVLYKSL